MNNGFLQGADGNFSNSRLIADIIAVVALVYAGALIVMKYLKPETDIMAMATASGVVFASLAGPALAFLFVQKKEECKQVEAKDEASKE